MDFDFTDDQTSLRDAVARWVEKGFSFERRHAIAKSGGKTREVYSELAELGLTGLAIPEDQGGMGFGAVEAMVVMEELGRGLVNAPYAAGALVAPTLLSAAPAGLRKAWLPKIASGDALVVLAHQERAARYRLHHVSTRATVSGGGHALTGTKGIVPAGDEADAFIVPARLSGADSDAFSPIVLSM
jgi:alkylation response protein AidB-like acyl-CoA dehydrogenase